MKTLADFTKLVQLCLSIAAEKYGEMPAVEISYDMRGRAAGEAGCLFNRVTGEATQLRLRFNREAIAKNWDEMVTQTIPHEVAHLVSFCFPKLGAKNHNWKWAEIDRALGGTGERCHKMELTPGRKTSRYIYRDSNGVEVTVGPKHHSGLQRGKYGYLRNSKTGGRIEPKDFLRAA